MCVIYAHAKNVSRSPMAGKPCIMLIRLRLGVVSERDRAISAMRGVVNRAKAGPSQNVIDSCLGRSRNVAQFNAEWSARP